MDDPFTSFGNAIRAAGLDLEGEPIMDGTRQRIATIDGKRGNKNGSYVGYSDGTPAGSIENFVTSVKQKWKHEGAQVEPLTPEQKEAIAARQQQRAADLAAQHATKALDCEKRWNRATVMGEGDTTPYLARKQVPAIGVRRDGDNLLVPLRDVDGKLWSLQTIFPEKRAMAPDAAPIDKVMAKGARKAGNFHLMGDIEAGKPILIAEGYATGTSARIASGHAVAIAFDSGNLDAVAGAIHARYPDSPMTILGDDDRHKAINAGREKATAAAEKHGAAVVFPQFAQEGPGTDFNDLHVTESLAAVKQQIDNSIHIQRSAAMSKEIGGETANAKPLEIPVLVSREEVAAQVVKTEQAQEAVAAPKKPRAPKKPAAEKPAAAPDMLTSIESAAPAPASAATEPTAKLEPQASSPAQTTTATMTPAERQAAIANEAVLHRQRVNDLLAGVSPMSDPEMTVHYRQLRAAEAAAQAAQAAAPAAPVVAITAQPAQVVATTVENSIENGASRMVAPDPAQTPGIGAAALAAEAQRNTNIKAAVLEASGRDTDDGKHLRAIIANKTELEQRVRGTMLHGEAGEFVKLDVIAIRSIKDADTRTLALLVMNDSKVAQMAYRQELSRQAPDVTLATDAAYFAQHRKDSGQAVKNFGSSSPAPANFADRSTAVPESVKARFVKVDNDYFWPDKTPAFIDRDTKLATRGENAEVIRSMVQIAKARDWTNITVKGTEEFRRAAWMEASLVGMHVDGYKPTALDKEELARRPSGNSVAHAAERVQAGTPVQSAAPVLSLVKPVEPAAAQVPVPNDPALQAKAADFLKEKPSFVVKKHEDLAPAYGTLDAAQKFADASFKKPEDRAKFVAIAKEVMATMIARGENVPAPMLRIGLEKNGPEVGKQQEKKEAGRER